MKVFNVVGLDVRYIMVQSSNITSLKEVDVLEHLKELGYKVFKNYGFYFRYTKKKAKEYFKDDVDRAELMNISPKFHNNVRKVFKKYPNGEPDVLVEKDGKWEFIEIKTTNDSLRPNQLIFIEELSRHHQTSIQHFTLVTEEIEMLARSEEVEETKLGYKRGEVDLLKDTLRSKLSKDTIKFRDLAGKRGYNKYWIIANVFKNYPDLLLIDKYINVVSRISGVPVKSIKWYITQNKKKIIETAIKDRSTNKKYTKRDVVLMQQYRKILDN